MSCFMRYSIILILIFILLCVIICQIFDLLCGRDCNFPFPSSAGALLLQPLQSFSRIVCARLSCSTYFTGRVVCWATHMLRSMLLISIWRSPLAQIHSVDWGSSVYVSCDIINCVLAWELSVKLCSSLHAFKTWKSAPPIS